MKPAGDSGTILALDIGSVRVGLALASAMAKMPRPSGALPNDNQLGARLRELCAREAVTQLVFGLPRGLDGQETRQTAAVRSLGVRLARELALPYQWQDEAVTSVRAEAELRRRGKPYAKQDVDALAAAYILEDYLHASV